MLKVDQANINSWLERLVKDFLVGDEKCYNLYLVAKGNAATLIGTNRRQRGIELVHIETDDELSEYIGEVTDYMSEQDIVYELAKWIKDEVKDAVSFYPRNLILEEEIRQINVAIYVAYETVRPKFSAISKKMEKELALA